MSTTIQCNKCGRQWSGSLFHEGERCPRSSHLVNGRPACDGVVVGCVTIPTAQLRALLDAASAIPTDNVASEKDIQALHAASRAVEEAAGWRAAGKDGE